MKSKDGPGPSTTTTKRIPVPSIQDGKLSTRSAPISRKSFKSAKSFVLPTTEENQIKHYVVIPPDGGWGWVIVVIAFISYFLMDGVCYTFGIFLSDIAETFHTETSSVALISSYMTGVYYFSGPVACALCNKFGFRSVAFFGSLFSTALFFGASYVENFLLFTIMIGFGIGFSFDLVYTVMLLDVAFYFERYRALATAISVIGVSAGIMGFPPIFKEASLLGNYHWRTKFLFIGGSFVVLTVLTLALKPIKPTLVIEEARQDDLGSDSIGTFILEESDTGLRISKIFDQFHNVAYPKISEYTSDFYVAKTPEDVSTYLAILPEQDNDSIPRSLFGRALSGYSSRLSGYHSTYVESEEEIACSFSTCCRQCFRCSTYCEACCGWCQQHWNTCWSFLCCANQNITRPMYRDDIMYNFGSLSRLPEYNRSHADITTKSIGSTYAKNISYHLSVSRVMTQKDVEEEKQCVCCPEAVLRVIATMLDVRLFKSLSFGVLVLSSFLTMIGLYAPFVFMVERGEELGLKDGWPTKLLSIMGLANCLGRIACGFVSFLPSMDPMVVSYMSLIVGGAFIMVSAFWTDIIGQLISVAVYGFCVVSPLYAQFCWRTCLA